MTRVTAPMSQLARTLTASLSVARPSSLASKALASMTHKDFGIDGRSSDHESARRGITTAHRPVTVQPNPNRTVPLMQTFFHSSAKAPARLDSSTLDFAVLPRFDGGAGEGDAATMMAAVRMPLLPDNFTPDRSAFALEVPDAPLPAAEISVIAAHPEKVFAALTEVEGLGVDGVELKFVHEPAPARSGQEPGMLKDVWQGLLDDVFGGQKKTSFA